MSTTPHSGSDQKIQQEMERTRSEAAELAANAAEAAKHKGREAVDRAKEGAAHRAEELASALEATADDLEADGGEERLSGYGRSMAELMRRFAGGLREHEIEEFAGQLAGFARRNPASFLAGSVALGFGVSRFLKATSGRPYEEYGYYDDDEDEYLFESEEDELEEVEPLSAAGSTGYESPAGADTASGVAPEDRRPGWYGAGSAAEREAPGDSSGPSAGSGSPIASPAVTPGEPVATETRSEGIRRNEP